MKPTIETSRIRANLRLAAELGDFPSELVPTIERALGLDYVEEQFKKKYKSNIKCFGKAVAEIFDEYDAHISPFEGAFVLLGKGFHVNIGIMGTTTIDARLFKNLSVINAVNKRISKRVKSVETIEDAKEIIAEENSKIENFIKHGE